MQQLFYSDDCLIQNSYYISSLTQEIVMQNIIKFYQKRRSIYHIGKELPISENKLKNLIEQCIINAPSAFNSQSGRVVLLSGKEHKLLWQIVLKTLAKITPENKFASTKIKISSFAAGYGSILFFEDVNTIQNLQIKYPLYKDAFESFAYQSSGMLQYMIWTSFAANNIGASLQHYNPLIDKEVKQQWQIPDSWQLISQMPFGNILEDASDKDYISLQERFLSFN